ncbi:hypothetical protein CC2G_013052 [Coprinopsis cinerea AmutBmut pab1-1]|nr:hypothetical protein CC2G_013052 [Coprinopsis cinerea AmutBmut pab1-1]
MKFLCRVFNQLYFRKTGDPDSQSTMSFGSTPSSFYHDELERALAEQRFGVHSYRILSSSPRQSSAFVTTLEGHKLNVALTAQGYTVESKRSDGTESTVPPRTYETIEDLLQAISPSYSIRRQERLISALQNISR